MLHGRIKILFLDFIVGLIFNLNYESQNEN